MRHDATLDRLRRTVALTGWETDETVVTPSCLVRGLGMSRRIQAALETPSVRRLRELMEDRTDTLVSLATQDGELLWASESGSKHVFGRDLDDFQGTNRFDYIHPDDLPQHVKHLERALQDETVRDTVRAKTADGGWKRTTALMWLVHTEQGPLVLTVTVPGSAEEA